MCLHYEKLYAVHQYTAYTETVQTSSVTGENFRPPHLNFSTTHQEQALGYCDYASGFNCVSSFPSKFWEGGGEHATNIIYKGLFFSPTTCIYNASGNFKVEFSKNIKRGNNLPSMKQMSIK